MAFTFGGSAYLWGYTDDRSHCGIWNATDLSAPPQMWPIGEQGEAWTRFWALEPNAVALSEPTPPPTPAPWSQGAPTSIGSAPPPYPATSGYVTSGSSVDDPRWRLVLSQGAKGLLVGFLILGALLSTVYGFRFFNNNALKSFEANIQIQVAYQSLNNAEATYESNIKACSTLGCLTGASAAVAPAFGTFVGKLNSVSVPPAEAPAKSELAADAIFAQQTFDKLALATSSSEYEDIIAASGQVVSQVHQDYQNLINKLGSFP